jgi:hypothetical protein
VEREIFTMKSPIVIASLLLAPNLSEAADAPTAPAAGWTTGAGREELRPSFR